MEDCPVSSLDELEHAAWQDMLTRRHTGGDAGNSRARDWMIRMRSLIRCDRTVAIKCDERSRFIHSLNPIIWSRSNRNERSRFIFSKNAIEVDIKRDERPKFKKDDCKYLTSHWTQILAASLLSEKKNQSLDKGADCRPLQRRSHLWSQKRLKFSYSLIIWFWTSSCPNWSKRNTGQAENRG